MNVINNAKQKTLWCFTVLVFTFHICYSQDVKENAFSSWYLETQGIRITKNTSLTLGYYEFQSLQLTTIEIPVLLKVKITDKLSALGGSTFDFYRTRQGLSSDFSIYGSAGLHYNINDDSFIQGTFSIPLKPSMHNQNYNMGSKPNFILRSKFRF